MRDVEFAEPMWAAVAAVAGYVLAKVKNADGPSVRNGVRAVTAGVSAALDATDGASRSQKNG